jgi:ribose transport system permease protein/ribose transport system ATP-binding protein
MSETATMSELLGSRASPGQDGATTLLRISDVTMTFPGVKALDAVSFDVLAGEVHGLVGENGAGKSTLMAVASGALTPTEGDVEIDGTASRGDPDRARDLGLAIVRQEPSLMPELSVAENIFLALPQRLRPPVAQMHTYAAKVLADWHSNLSFGPRDLVSSLNPEQRFIVEIGKSLAARPNVLVLDEPTEHLQAADVARLFECIREVTQRGAAVVYISHRIREVRQVASRVRRN